MTFAGHRPEVEWESQDVQQVNAQSGVHGGAVLLSGYGVGVPLDRHTNKQIHSGKTQTDKRARMRTQFTLTLTLAHTHTHKYTRNMFLKNIILLEDHV